MNQVSSARSTAASETESSSSWWSAPKASATSRASASSFLSASSTNPTENVFTGSLMLRAINATMRLESRPPLSIAPSGTSLISRRRTDSSSPSSRPSIVSSSERSGRGAGSGYAQYCSTRTPSGSTTSECPGISFETPASGVAGAGKKPKVR